MEYIHKAKAEKSRTKVLSDQMEARRTKNKVLLCFHVLCDRRLIHPTLLGCSGTPRPEDCREATSVPGGGRGTRKGVNIPYTTRFHMSSLLLYAMHRMHPANLRTRAPYCLPGPSDFNLLDSRIRENPSYSTFRI